MIGIKIISLVSGGHTPFDGQWLKEYDPDRRGRDPHGQPMLAHIVCTPDPREAMAFRTFTGAHAVWTKPSTRWPNEGRKQADGRLNRPLTAFTVEIRQLP